jgi:hypothetical protein
VLPAYAVEVGTEPLVRPARNSVGGWPFLDQAQVAIRRPSGRSTSTDASASPPLPCPSGAR